MNVIPHLTPVDHYSKVYNNCDGPPKLILPIILLTPVVGEKINHRGCQMTVIKF